MAFLTDSHIYTSMTLEVEYLFTWVEDLNSRQNYKYVAFQERLCKGLTPYQSSHAVLSIYSLYKHFLLSSVSCLNTKNCYNFSQL